MTKLEKTLKAKPLPAPTTTEQEMERNAELVIMRHRALYAKPGELKDVVKLPLKRSRSVYQTQNDYQIDLPADSVCALVKLVHNMLTSELESSQMKKLENDFKQKLKEVLQTEEQKAKLPKLQNSLKYLIVEFDVKKEDKRTLKVLEILSTIDL